MKISKGKVLVSLITLILAGIYYYLELPAVNMHYGGFWKFIIAVVAIATVVYLLRRRVLTIEEAKMFRGTYIGLGTILVLFCVYLIGALLSSPIVNAKRYQEMLAIEERDFSEDIRQADFNQIPLLDKDSAVILGERKMGSMVEMVSQFEVSDLYSQINYQGKPVRVSPLMYASPIKWLTNHNDGIPAYMRIDMTTQDVELVKLDKPIRYSEAEYFNRNIYRHLRFSYPTYIFDQLSFEIDDEGTPYWICPVKKFTIGLFGGQTIGRVVLCNAQTGETMDYAIEDCPQWVDRAHPADLLIQLYNYHGKLVNGFFNSIFSQKGCLKSTDGYNYLAIDDDVWVYTGVTSVNSDQSNVGFVLMNQRTRETRYYAISGAEEYSAMSSAEGQVQNLKYKATFPLLLNIADEPTYFMALKDDAGLVKKYAMLNVQRYQSVAIGDTVAECRKEYGKLLSSSGISKDQEEAEAAGSIEKIVQAVKEGNSVFYIMLSGRDEIFEVPVNEFVKIVSYSEGDFIRMRYMAGEPVCIVTGFD